MTFKTVIAIELCESDEWEPCATFLNGEYLGIALINFEDKEASRFQPRTTSPLDKDEMHAAASWMTMETLDEMREAGYVVLHAAKHNGGYELIHNGEVLGHVSLQPTGLPYHFAADIPLTDKNFRLVYVLIQAIRAIEETSSELAAKE